VLQFRRGELQFWPEGTVSFNFSRKKQKVAELIGRELVESIGLDGVFMAEFGRIPASSGAGRELKLHNCLRANGRKGI
jgi:hypothetical protein